MSAEIYMPDAVPKEIPLRPPETTITSHLPLRNVDIYEGRAKLDYIAPFLVMESARAVTSPFYEVNPVDPDSYSIGLEDKLLGTPEIADARLDVAPYRVAKKFGEMGSQMLKNIKLLHGEDWASRAEALMRYGNVASSGPQRDLDRQILADLNVAYKSLLLRLNANVTPEGHEFRQRIYKELGKTEQIQDRIGYSGNMRQVQVPNIETVSKYPKTQINKVLESLTEENLKGWLFLRSLVARITDPKVRAAILAANI